MSLSNFFIYVPLVIAIVILLIKRKGMKHYLAVGLFASFMANVICHVAMIFNFWSYPFKPEEAIVNCIIVPVAAMFWVRYSPRGLVNLIYWNLLWTIPITAIEYNVEHFTNVIKYHNGYNSYYSVILWFICWFIWYSFHLWFNNETM